MRTLWLIKHTVVLGEPTPPPYRYTFKSNNEGAARYKALRALARDFPGERKADWRQATPEEAAKLSGETPPVLVNASKKRARLEAGAAGADKTG